MSDFYVTLADDIAFAYRTVFGSDPTREQVIAAMCVAQFETNSGRAWISHNGAINLGAVQWRSLTASELAAYKAKALERYDTVSAQTPGGPGGILIDTDSDPNSGGFVAWYAAFKEQVDAAVYFVRAVFKTAAERAASSYSDLAVAMYQAGYYGGVHPGARPVGQRNPPFNTAEQANIDAYTKGLAGAYATIAPHLANWQPDPNQAPSAPPGSLFIGDWPPGASGIASSPTSGRWLLAAFAVTGLSLLGYHYRRNLRKFLTQAVRKI